ncbi:MAG: hypothetical protein QXK76_04105 [Candidatus Woesearchaeota archaeon]
MKRKEFLISIILGIFLLSVYPAYSTTSVYSTTYTQPILTSLALEGKQGTSVFGTVTFSGSTVYTGNLIVSDLYFGNNIIRNTNIQVSELNSFIDAIVKKYNVQINIPYNQVPGTYFGTIRFVDNGKVVAESIISLKVNSINQPNITQGASFTINDLEFGSDSQKRGERITSNLILRNTGTLPLTIALSSNAASQYELQFSQNSVFVASGATVEVPVSIYVPLKQNSGKVNIATITASASGITKTSTAYLTTKSELEITKVRIVVDGDSSTLDDGEDVEAKAGDDVELTITVKNTFDENVDIEDIDVNVESDSDLDWDEEKSIGDLKNGKKKDVTFSFVVPRNIDEDDYDVEITVNGRDENGARHKTTFTFTIEVDRTSNEITITEATISPSRISCGGKVNLRTTIENTGSNNQRNVALEILNSDLNLEQYFTRISLRRDDDITKTVTFNVNSDTTPGEYLIYINTYYDNKLSDTKIVSLMVDKCNIGSNTNQQQNETITPIVYPQGTSGPVYGKAGILDNTTYMVLLVILVILLLLLIIFLLFKYVF